METGYRDVVLRSRPAQVLTALVIAACVVAQVGFVIAGDPLRALTAAAPLGLVSLVAWAAFWRPEVRVDPAQVVLVGPLRTVAVTWPAIVDIHGRWGLELETARGRYSAWAAPRSGSAAAGLAARAAVRRKRVGAIDAEVPGSDLDSAASTVVLRRWTEYRDAGLLGRTEGTGVRVLWHRWTCAGLALLVVATAAATLVR